MTETEVSIHRHLERDDAFASNILQPSKGYPVGDSPSKSTLANLSASRSSAVNRPAMIVLSGITIDLSDEQLKKAHQSILVIESRLMDFNDEQESKAASSIVVIEQGRRIESREEQEKKQLSLIEVIELGRTMF